MPRAPKSCGRYGCPNTVVGQTYCPTHEAERQAKRRANTPLSPTSRAANERAERRRRAEAVQAWVRVHGWVCPGYQRDPHESRDLTAAHAVAVAAGGTHSVLTVLCRPCNSKQGTKPT